MGIIHYVGCWECRVYRNLDKPVINNRADALRKTRELEATKSGATIRHVLLASFMLDHKVHNCSFFDEYQQDLLEQWDGLCRGPP